MKNKQTIASIIAMALAVIYCLGLIMTAGSAKDTGGETGSPSTIDMSYEETLFTSDYVHEIHIEIPEGEWADLKEQALYKECYDSTVTVDGETFYHVGIRTKGNVTLLQSIVREWDKYSLVLEFDAFDESQRYHGLDKLALNNSICDSSFLRDYLCYDMMRSMGVPTPLCSYTALYLNGEYLGLYTTTEFMGESFTVRNFGYDYGNLYKPEHMNIAGMLTGEEKDCTLNLSALSSENGSVDAADFLGVTDTTVGLLYQGESLLNYTDIWDNAVFQVGTTDKQRVVDAIRVINNGGNLEEVLNTDMLLRYFAVSSFVLNDDCYTSYAGHNYGLYEKDGKLMLIPWDYDHSLGCMGASSGSSTWTELINLPIDEPVIGVEIENRPLLNCLLSDETYKAQYYAYMDQFLKDYVESGRLEETAERLVQMILPYIEQEPTGNISVEQFHAAVKSDMDFCSYRYDSMRGQLDGEIPTTLAGQAAAPETLVDCSDFISPDSGSLTELLMPEGSGLYFENLIGSLIPRINTMATISILPIDTIADLAFSDSDSEGSLIQKMTASGKIGSQDAFRKEVKQLIFNFVTDILHLLCVPVVLVFGLVFAFRYGKKRQPIAKKSNSNRKAVE